MSLHPPRWTMVLAAATLSLGACQGVTVDTGAPPASTPDAADASTATEQLDELTVMTKAGSMSGYSRVKFPHWRTTGDNCDVRDTVLKRDGTKVRFSGCNVVAGTWRSIYDDKSLTSPKQVDIDHMVPLANAWRSGAASWDTDKRSDFANDLDRPQLVAVSLGSNRSKGDQDPSTWKPPAEDAWCEYAEDWITVKAYWKLSVTAREKSALHDMLRTC